MKAPEDDQKVILIVDDDPMLLKLYEKMFQVQGIKALFAEDGEAGLKLIRTQKPRFVILDIRMPKMNGIEVLKTVRNDDAVKDTPVLMLTNFGLDEYRDEIKPLGVVDFLVKTEVDPRALVKRVAQFLGDKGTSDT